jgi:hypothetical protein
VADAAQRPADRGHRVLRARTGAAQVAGERLRSVRFGPVEFADDVDEAAGQQAVHLVEEALAFGPRGLQPGPLLGWSSRLKTTQAPMMLPRHSSGTPITPRSVARSDSLMCPPITSS